MAVVLKPFVFPILKKHLGSGLYVIIKEKDSYSLKEGILTKYTSESIVLDNKKYENGMCILPFEYMGKKKIYHIFNNLTIDLLTAKESQPLSKKLRSGDAKVLIGSLKPYLQKILHIVFRTNRGIMAANGKFVDMGISELILKLAPFFNAEERLNYQSILHIYGDDDDDLIG